MTRLSLKMLGLVAVSLLCVELFVRMFVVSPAVVRFDTELGPMKAPFSDILRTYEGWNRYTTDAYGFNNDEVLELKAKHRLLVLGDSFVEAKHVPRADNFVGRLNAMPDVLAYNAGYSGADPRSFPVLAARFVPIIKPTQLVLVVNADDLTALAGTAPAPYTPPTGIKAWLQPLFAHSALATHLNWKYKPVLQPWWQKWFAPADIQPVHHQQQDYQVYAKRWAAILDALLVYDVPICVVVMPNIRYTAGGVLVLADVREELLADVAASKGCKVLRTEQAFAHDFAQTGQVGLGFQNSHLGTGHLNVRGHAIVARLLADALVLR